MGLEPTIPPYLSGRCYPISLSPQIGSPSATAPSLAINWGGLTTYAPPRENCFVVGIIQHFFSELALVHICIPQTYTPCGRVMGQRSNSLSWAPVLSVALPSPFVPLLYHTLRDLSRGFSNFFEKSFRLALSHSYQCLGVCGLLPSPLDALIVS